MEVNDLNNKAENNYNRYEFNDEGKGKRKNMKNISILLQTNPLTPDIKDKKQEEKVTKKDSVYERFKLEMNKETKKSLNYNNNTNNTIKAQVVPSNKSSKKILKTSSPKKRERDVKFHQIIKNNLLNNTNTPYTHHINNNTAITNHEIDTHHSDFYLKARLKNSNKLPHYFLDKPSHHRRESTPLTNQFNFENKTYHDETKLDFKNESILQTKIIDVLKKTKEKIQNNSYFSFSEIKILMKYLDSLPNFIHSVKDKNEDYYNDLLKNISSNMKYDYGEKGKILFKFGDYGDVFFIIVKGEVSVLIPKNEKALLTENEFIQYLMLLRKHNEFELIAKTLQDNFSMMKLSTVEEFDLWLQEVFLLSVEKKLSQKEAQIRLKQDALENIFKIKFFGNFSSGRKDFKSSIETLDFVTKRSSKIIREGKDYYGDLLKKDRDGLFGFNMNSINKIGGINNINSISSSVYSLKANKNSNNGNDSISIIEEVKESIHNSIRRLSSHISLNSSANNNNDSEKTDFPQRNFSYYPDNIEDIEKEVIDTLKIINLQKLIIEKDDEYVDKDQYLNTINKYSLKMKEKNKSNNKGVKYFVRFMNNIHPDLTFQSEKYDSFSNEVLVHNKATNNSNATTESVNANTYKINKRNRNKDNKNNYINNELSDVSEINQESNSNSNCEINYNKKNHAYVSDRSNEDAFERISEEAGSSSGKSNKSNLYSLSNIYESVSNNEEDSISNNNEANNKDIKNGSNNSINSNDNDSEENSNNDIKNSNSHTQFKKTKTLNFIEANEKAQKEKQKAINNYYSNCNEDISNNKTPTNRKKKKNINFNSIEADSTKNHNSNINNPSNNNYTNKRRIEKKINKNANTNSSTNTDANKVTNSNSNIIKKEEINKNGLVDKIFSNSKAFNRLNSLYIKSTKNTIANKSNNNNNNNRLVQNYSSDKNTNTCTNFMKYYKEKVNPYIGDDIREKNHSINESDRNIDSSNKSIKNNRSELTISKYSNHSSRYGNSINNLGNDSSDNSEDKDRTEENNENNETINQEHFDSLNNSDSNTNINLRNKKNSNYFNSDINSNNNNSSLNLQTNVGNKLSNLKANTNNSISQAHKARNTVTDISSLKNIINYNNRDKDNDNNDNVLSGIITKRACKFTRSQTLLNRKLDNKRKNTSNNNDNNNNTIINDKIEEESIFNKDFKSKSNTKRKKRHTHRKSILNLNHNKEEEEEEEELVLNKNYNEDNFTDFASFNNNNISNNISKRGAASSKKSLYNLSHSNTNNISNNYSSKRHKNTSQTKISISRYSSTKANFFSGSNNKQSNFNKQMTMSLNNNNNNNNNNNRSTSINNLNSSNNLSAFDLNINQSNKTRSQKRKPTVSSIILIPNSNSNNNTNIPTNTTTSIPTISNTNINNTTNTNTTTNINNKKPLKETVKSILTRRRNNITSTTTSNNNTTNTQNNIKNKTRKLYSIYYYTEVTKLKNGDYFGEKALEANQCPKRTATILCEQNTHFAIIEKNSYNDFLKDISKKIRLKTINNIRINTIFNNTNFRKFEIHFFNKFKIVKFHKGDVILRQFEKMSGVFFTKEGSFEVSFKGSFLDLNHISECLSGYSKSVIFSKEFLEKEEVEMMNKRSVFKVLNFSDQKVESNANTKAKININNGNSNIGGKKDSSILFSEIIGIDDFCYLEKALFLERRDTPLFFENSKKDNHNLLIDSVSLFDVSVISSTAQVFFITTKDFIDVLNLDSKIKDNYLKLRKHRVEIMRSRIENLRDSWYQRLVDTRRNNTDSTMKSNLLNAFISNNGNSGNNANNTNIRCDKFNNFNIIESSTVNHIINSDYTSNSNIGVNYCDVNFTHNFFSGLHGMAFNENYSNNRLSTISLLNNYDYNETNNSNNNGNSNNNMMMIPKLSKIKVTENSDDLLYSNYNNNIKNNRNSNGGTSLSNNNIKDTLNFNMSLNTITKTDIKINKSRFHFDKKDSILKNPNKTNTLSTTINTDTINTIATKASLDTNTHSKYNNTSKFKNKNKHIKIVNSNLSNTNNKRKISKINITKHHSCVLEETRTSNTDINCINNAIHNIKNNIKTNKTNKTNNANTDNNNINNHNDIKRLTKKLQSLQDKNDYKNKKKFQTHKTILSFNLEQSNNINNTNNTKTTNLRNKNPRIKSHMTLNSLNTIYSNKINNANILNSQRTFNSLSKNSNLSFKMIKRINTITNLNKISTIKSLPRSYTIDKQNDNNHDNHNLKIRNHKKNYSYFGNKFGICNNINGFINSEYSEYEINEEEREEYIKNEIIKQSCNINLLSVSKYSKLVSSSNKRRNRSMSLDLNKLNVFISKTDLSSINKNSEEYYNCMNQSSSRILRKMELEHRQNTSNTSNSNNTKKNEDINSDYIDDQVSTNRDKIRIECNDISYEMDYHNNNSSILSTNRYKKDTKEHSLLNVDYIETDENNAYSNINKIVKDLKTDNTRNLSKRKIKISELNNSNYDSKDLIIKPNNKCVSTNITEANNYSNNSDIYTKRKDNIKELTKITIPSKTTTTPKPKLSSLQVQMLKQSPQQENYKNIKKTYTLSNFYLENNSNRNNIKNDNRLSQHITNNNYYNELDINNKKYNTEHFNTISNSITTKCSKINKLLKENNIRTKIEKELDYNNFIKNKLLDTEFPLNSKERNIKIKDLLTTYTKSEIDKISNNNKNYNKTKTQINLVKMSIDIKDKLSKIDKMIDKKSIMINEKTLESIVNSTFLSKNNSKEKYNTISNDEDYKGTDNKNKIEFNNVKHRGNVGNKIVLPSLCKDTLSRDLNSIDTNVNTTNNKINKSLNTINTLDTLNSINSLSSFNTTTTKFNGINTSSSFRNHHNLGSSVSSFKNILKGYKDIQNTNKHTFKTSRMFSNNYNNAYGNATKKAINMIPNNTNNINSKTSLISSLLQRSSIKTNYKKKNSTYTHTEQNYKCLHNSVFNKLFVEMYTSNIKKGNEVKEKKLDKINLDSNGKNQHKYTETIGTSNISNSNNKYSSVNNDQVVNFLAADNFRMIFKSAFSKTLPIEHYRNSVNNKFNGFNKNRHKMTE